MAQSAGTTALRAPCPITDDVTLLSPSASQASLYSQFHQRVDLPNKFQRQATIISMPSWDNKPSGKMIAAVLSSPGASPPSKCFTIDKEYPKPTLPSQSWVLVKVKAAGLNRAELRGRNGDEPAPPEFGMFVDEFHPDPPKILGVCSSKIFACIAHVTDSIL